MLTAIAQPANDECINAIDVSYLFSGSCAIVNTSAVFAMQDEAGIPATLGNDDPAKPDCFYDFSSVLERTVWFVITVPDLNGDGSDIQYEINTSIDGLQNPLGGDGDTQLVLYDGSNGCPTSSIGASDYIACSDDLFGSSPYISGFEVTLTPGNEYYLLIDTYNGVTVSGDGSAPGEFVFEVIPCGNVCGDNICGSNETYCSCQADCVCDLLYMDLANTDGYFTDDCINDNVFVTSDYILQNFGYSNPGSIYLLFGLSIGIDCNGYAATGANITYNNGSLIYGNFMPTAIPNGGIAPENTLLFFELDLASQMMGSITITATVDDGTGTGTECQQSQTVIFNDCASFQNPQDAECVAGYMNTSFGLQTVCIDDVFCAQISESDLTYSGCANGLEYAFSIWGDPNNTGTSTVQLSNWFVADSNFECFDPSTTLVNELDSNYSLGPLPSGTYYVKGGIFCFDELGNIVGGCTSEFELPIEYYSDNTNTTCYPGCTAGSLNQTLVGQTIIPTDVIDICTDGTEDLTLYCDYISSWQYCFQLWTDPDGDGIANNNLTGINNCFIAQPDPNWTPGSPLCTQILAADLFVDYTGNFFPNGLVDGNYLIVGTAFCQQFLYGDDLEFCNSPINISVNYNGNTNNNCGDTVCDSTENYCSCQLDCSCDIIQMSWFNTDLILTNDCINNDVFVTGNYMIQNYGYGNIDNLYMLYGFVGGEDCNGNIISTANITYNNGALFQNGSPIGSGNAVNETSLLYFELDAAAQAFGSITITGSIDDGTGSICENTETIVFNDCTSFQNPADVSCLAGTLDVINDQQIVCVDGIICAPTNGNEDLTLPGCDELFVYAYSIWIGDVSYPNYYNQLSNWVITDPSDGCINANTIMVDDIGYYYYEPYFPNNILPSGSYYLQGAALCLDQNGDIVSTCLTPNRLVINWFSDINNLECNPPCYAGALDQTLSNQNVTSDGFIELCTDGSEDLTLLCDEGWQYCFQLFADTNGTGSATTNLTGIENCFTAEFPLNWTPGIPICIQIPTADFMVDYTGNYYPNGFVDDGSYYAKGSAICFDENGNVIEECYTTNDISFDFTEIINDTCGDTECGSTENYCSCEADCVCQLFTFQYLNTNNSPTIDCSESVFVTADYMLQTYQIGNPDNIYLLFRINTGSDCNGSLIDSINVNYDNGTLYVIDDWPNAIQSGGLAPRIMNLVFELDAAAQAAGSITVSGSINDGTGIGTYCEQTLIIDFSDCPSFSNPAGPSCFPGSLNVGALNNQIVTCVDDTIIVATNNDENLALSECSNNAVYAYSIWSSIFVNGSPNIQQSDWVISETSDTLTLSMFNFYPLSNSGIESPQYWVRGAIFSVNDYGETELCCYSVGEIEIDICCYYDEDTDLEIDLDCDNQSNCTCDMLSLDLLNTDLDIANDCSESVFVSGDHMIQNYAFGNFESVYLWLTVLAYSDCNGNDLLGANITYDNGVMYEANGANPIPIASGDFVSEATSLFIELDEAAQTIGSITITASVDNGLGTLCEQTQNIVFADCTSFNNAIDDDCSSCRLSSILSGQVLTCYDPIQVSTDEEEELSLDYCENDYLYGYSIWSDPYNIGEGTQQISDWIVTDPDSSFPIYDEMTNPSIPGNPTPSLPGTYYMVGAAICFDNYGNIISVFQSMNQTAFQWLVEPDDECAPLCSAGDVDDTLSGQLINPESIVELCTDGTEDLTLLCDQGWQYCFQLFADPNQTGEPNTNLTGVENCFIAAPGPNWTPGMPLCIQIPAADFMVDYTIGNNLDEIVNGTYYAYGAAICYDQNGSVIEYCTTPSAISLNYDGNIWLPIELINLAGKATVNGNLIKWSTASEIENDYFTLESSKDGVNFSAIKTVKGNGTTSNEMHYEFLDRNAQNGITYYRLSQTDFDGTTKEVGIINVKRSDSEFGITDIYPFPANAVVNIEYNSLLNEKIQIEIYDVLGKLINSKTVYSNAGNNLHSINVENFSIGVYIVSISSNELIATDKFIVE